MGWSIVQFLVPFGVMSAIVLLVMAPLSAWMSHKLRAMAEERIGPNRIHVWGFRLSGVWHSLAVMIRVLMRQEKEPANSERYLFRAAPYFSLIGSVLALSLIPFAHGVEVSSGHLSFQVANVHASVLFFLMLNVWGLFGIISAGWSSNKQATLQSAIERVTQVFVYRLGVALSMLALCLAYGTAELNMSVHQQSHLPWLWGAAISPFGLLLCGGCVLAELRGNPFADTDSPIRTVPQYRSEYVGWKSAVFGWGDTLHLFSFAALITTMFLGGWQVPGLSTQQLERHSATLLAVFLIFLGGLLCLLGASALHRMLRPAVVFGDARDRESRRLFPIALGVGLVCLWCGIWLLGWGWSVRPWGQVTIRFAFQLMAFVGKMLFCVFMFLWIRLSWPVFRSARSMRVAVLYVVPLGIFNLFLTLVFSWGVRSFGLWE